MDHIHEYHRPLPPVSEFQCLHFPSVIHLIYDVPELKGPWLDS